MIDAKHPLVPFGGETENGFRKFCAQYAADGLKCSSAGTGPAQVAVAIKTALAALEGQVVPQSVRLPLAIVEDPNFKARPGLLPRPVRQLLRRQRLPDLRHQLHRAGDHGPDARTTSKPATRGAPRALPRRLLRSSAGGDPMDGAEPLFRMEGVSKRYGGVARWRRRPRRRAGRIHAVLGENGAGKSTLIKIMAGVVQPDDGSMTLDGRAVRFPSPAAANDAGIVCIFQELSLDPRPLGRRQHRHPPAAPRFGMIDRRAQRRLAEEALARAGADDIHPLALVKDLPLSRRQMVEIAKALAQRPRILILDEATSALTAADVEKVFAVLKRLRSEGLALVYISHRMHEIEALADDCTVFRNGRNVATYAAGPRSDQEVVEMMIGREYSHVFPPRTARAELPEPPARLPQPHLDRPPARRLLHRRPRRGRRPRRPRRPGPARPPARALRRPARPRRAPSRSPAGLPRSRARPGRAASAWRSSPRTARPKG